MSELANREASEVRPSTAGQLDRACDPARPSFATTAEIAPVEGIVGQERALEALRLGALREARTPSTNDAQAIKCLTLRP